MSEDKHLLNRLRCGDTNALRRLYEKYRDDLFTVGLSLLHDITASEDCLQDVFVTFASGISTLDIRRNLKGYLVSCVVNRARDYLRKKTPQLDCPLEDLERLAVLTDPLEQMIDSEKSRLIFLALAQVPYEQREVFVLHVHGDMKFRQIADLQAVSIKTVQSRYRYAIDKLRELLEKENTYEVRA